MHLNCWAGMANLQLFPVFCNPLIVALDIRTINKRINRVVYDGNEKLKIVLQF
jgi:hypothetical protein